jgi:hypothetical protein
MKNTTKKRISTMIVAVMLCMAAFPVSAYTGGGEEIPEEPTTEAAVPEATAPNPFTPDGTGTVIDNATDGDGKEFFTIMTPSENVFYLVIDRQRETENVYFLNAVTEQDLMALAEITADTGGVSAIPEPEPTPDPTPEPEPETTPEPEPAPEQGSNMGMMILIAVAVLGGGGAAYYLKIYRPKQARAEAEEDFEEYEAEDDGPPWYEDGSESGEDE